MNKPLKVGVVGARGIGKHHAKWYTLAGCEVTAVYGTTEQTAAAAARGIDELCGFSGRAFHDWQQFRREGGFEACSICSSVEGHAQNVYDLAADGVHLLCEKPLVWSWSQPAEWILAESRRVVEAAEAAGVLLGVNAQYPAALEGWTELHRAALARDPEYRSLSFIMETKGPQRTPHGAAEAWVDLGPHPLALLDTVAPGHVLWETLRHADGPNEAVTDFTWAGELGPVTVHIECRRSMPGALRRRIGNQDFEVDYDGVNVDGVFCARLRAGEREWVGRDFMRVSVERFIEAVQGKDPSRLLVDGRATLRQQEALVGVRERAWPESRW
jgi:predicted dehydrogenase